MGTEGKESMGLENAEVECARLHTSITPSPPGVTFPSGEAQEQLIQSLYRPAGLAPESLAYIEAHGTGTKVIALSSPYLTPAPLLERFLAAALTSLCPLQVGDPQELNSIVRALCASRQGPLLIGSTKSNMGHPEPASGLAALAKVSRLGSGSQKSPICG